MLEINEGTARGVPRLVPPVVLAALVLALSLISHPGAMALDPTRDVTQYV